MRKPTCTQELNKVVTLQQTADLGYKLSHLTPVHTLLLDFTSLMVLLFFSAKTHITEFISLADSLGIARVVLWFRADSPTDHHVLYLSTMAYE